jgi:hypothetical protein
VFVEEIEERLDFVD